MKMIVFKRIVMKKILATGRLTDREETTRLTSVHIDKDVIKWIEENSSGNKQLIFNRLMQEGIKSIHAMENTVVIENLKS
jgi:hypothetical protein